VCRVGSRCPPAASAGRYMPKTHWPDYAENVPGPLACLCRKRSGLITPEGDSATRPRWRSVDTQPATRRTASSSRSLRRAGRRRYSAYRRSRIDCMLPTPQRLRSVAASELFGLAQDLEAAWNAPLVSTPARQRLMRTLIVDVVADVDEASREIVVTVHWRGGQHSQLRVRKPASGEHGCSTPEQAIAVIRSMATRWSDEDIAASLNRMGMRTGQGKTWTAHRVSSLRRVRDIPAYRSATKDGEWVTMSEAASMLGVTNHAIRRLIKDGILAAEQVVPGAPFQIRTADLQSPEVGAAIARKVRPCRVESENQVPMFTVTYEGGAQ